LGVEEAQECGEQAGLADVADRFEVMLHLFAEAGVGQLEQFGDLLHYLRVK
jgi:hypothetical protein